MKNRIFLSLIILLFPCLLAGQSSPILYSFFVAGHAYGQPGVDNIGLHPPFKAKFDYIKSRPEITMGFLTGDIVIRGTEKNWDEVDADIDSLGIPVWFAVGNHDMSDRPLFEERYGPTYFSFTENGDLFIVLDPNLDSWRISGDQLVFLNRILDTYASETENVFVFFHQMLWWSPDNIYKDLASNSLEDRAADINFWTEIEPMFNALDNKVFMYAGDVGAGAWAIDCAYDCYDNISFIASGMGEGPGDNFVITNIHYDRSVSYDLICLNHRELNCLGELKNYRISTGLNIMELENSIKIYPNPAVDNLIVVSQKIDNLQIIIFNSTGQKILELEHKGIGSMSINLDNVPKGLLFVQVISGDERSVHRIVH